MDLYHNTHNKGRQQLWPSQLAELQEPKEKNENTIEETSEERGEGNAWG
jgi:hypothetical protein